MYEKHGRCRATSPRVAWCGQACERCSRHLVPAARKDSCAPPGQHPLEMLQGKLPHIGRPHAGKVCDFGPKLANIRPIGQGAAKLPTPAPLRISPTDALTLPRRRSPRLSLKTAQWEPSRTQPSSLSFGRRTGPRSVQHRSDAATRNGPTGPISAKFGLPGGGPRAILARSLSNVAFLVERRRPRRIRAMSVVIVCFCCVWRSEVRHRAVSAQSSFRQ